MMKQAGDKERQNLGKSVICLCAHTEMPVAVRNTRVSQKSLSSLTTGVIMPESIMWLLHQEVEGVEGIALYLYLHLNLSFRGHREVLHQKAAAASPLSLK